MKICLIFFVLACCCLPVKGQDIHASKDDNLAFKGYALLIGNEEYEEFQDLSGPVKGLEEIKELLIDIYGYDVQLVANANRETIIDKIKELYSKPYLENDHLLFFYGGHAFFNRTDEMGYLVPTDGKLESMSSHISYSQLQNLTEMIPCNHLLVVVDGAFGRPFSQTISRIPNNKNLNFQRRIKWKTQYYLTSGGKEYIPGSGQGEPSEFTYQFIQALESRGGDDQILNLTELTSFMERLIVIPAMGSFGSDQPGSDFLFIVK